MNGLDWVIVVVVLVSTLLAVAQGFFFEIFSLVGAVVGYIVASWSYKSVAPWFVPYVKNFWIADAAAFLLVFIAIVVLAGVIARLARWAMQEVGLRWFDRLAQFLRSPWSAGGDGCGDSVGIVLTIFTDVVRLWFSAVFPGAGTWSDLAESDGVSNEVPCGF